MTQTPQTDQVRKSHVNHWDGNHPFQRAGRIQRDAIDERRTDPDARLTVTTGSYSYPRGK
jgi:hypothetical protein